MSLLDEALTNSIKPLESPLRSGAYDFETLLTRSHSEFSLIEGQPATDYMSLTANSIPYYLHACTNFGRFHAQIRTNRDQAFKSVYNQIDRNSLVEIEKHCVSQNSSFLSEDVLRRGSEESFADHMTDSGNFHLRDHIRSYLLYYRSIYDPYKEKEIASTEFLNWEVQGYGLTEAIGKYRWQESHGEYNPVYKDVRNSMSYYFGTAKSQVRYHGEKYETISVRMMLQSYWGLGEILLKHHVDPDNTQNRLIQLANHESYAVLKMILYGLNVVINHYNVTMLAPTLLYIIELALNGPYAGSKDYKEELDDQAQLYPPKRLYEICKSFPAKHSVLTCQDLLAESVEPRIISNFFDETKNLTSLQYFLDLKCLSFPNLERSILQSLDTAAPGDLDWFRWYLSLSSFTSSRIFRRCNSVTNYIVNMIKAGGDEQLLSGLDFAPVSLDCNNVMSAFSVFHWDINGHEESFLRTRAFLKCQTENFAKTSFLTKVGTEDMQFLPFKVPDELLFDRWLGIEKSHFFRSCFPWKC